MADFTVRMVTTTTVEYVLPSPTNWAEVAKVMAGIRQRWPDLAEFDDSVTVETRDDEIVFSFVEEREARPL